MTVSPRRYANAVVLSVAGRLDQDTCDAFRGDLMKHMQQTLLDGGVIIMDLAGLEYISSAGLRCFMLASRQAKAQHGRVVVAALQSMVSEIFRISHFNLLFQVFPTVKEALGATSAEALAAFEKATP